MNPSPHITHVHRNALHTFSKHACEAINLIVGIGVDGDAHAGATVKHRSRVARDPTQPNLRQVHLIHHELIDELNARGFDIAPGVMGENITTRGIDLLGLPRGATLKLGAEAVTEITGLRNPCKQLNDYRPGLMDAVLDHDEQDQLVRKAGVLAIVIHGGVVRPNDAIAVELPTPPFQKLAPI